MEHSEIYKNARVYWFKRVSLTDGSDKICLVKTRDGQTAPNQEDAVISIVEGFQNWKAFFEMPDGELANVLLSVDWEHLPMYNSRCLYQAGTSIHCSLLEFQKTPRFGSL
jgi:hypothetical protein